MPRSTKDDIKREKLPPIAQAEKDIALLREHADIGASVHIRSKMLNRMLDNYEAVIKEFGIDTPLGAHGEKK